MFASILIATYVELNRARGDRECFAFDVPCGRLNQTSPIGALLLGDLGFDGIAKPNSSRHCLDSSCVELLSTEVM
jgi:hypothetical protein